MGGLLAKRPTIVIEVLNREIGEAVEKILAPYDYKFSHLANGIVPVEHIVADHIPNSNEYNYLAEPRR